VSETVARPDAGAAAGTRALWKSVALPNEHGGWGMLSEPLLLGLALAPSAAGAYLAVASLAAFLARHPLKLAVSDRRRGSRYPRTVAAERMALLYAALALGAATAALAAGGSLPLLPLLPLLAVAPLAAVQARYDARLQGRQLVPELCGGIALAALAPAVLLAGGFAPRPSLAAGALVALKAVTSVLYVRTRLRLDRGQFPRRGPAVAAHAIAAGSAAGLAAAGAAPWTGVGATGVLLLRALHGLSSRRRRVRPQVLGFRELGLGIAYVVALALGYAWSL
jgi:YwiC-like protein